MLIETLGAHEALELALTAAAGDVATGGLLFARRVIRPRSREVVEAADTAATASITELKRLSWGVFSQMLFWAFEQLGYDVELAPTNGVVDFILTDGRSRGYTYVQARRWQKDVVTSDDIAELRKAMEVVDVERGIWLSVGEFTERARRAAEKAHVTLVGADELAVIIDRIRDKMGAG